MLDQLSVCIIAKNEENNIERCLKSLIPLGAEIVVIDTGSTDHTKEIAARYTKYIYDFTWINDFSAARNFSVKKASNDWILYLDCDEYVTSFDETSLIGFMKSNPYSVGEIRHHNLTGTENNQSIFTVDLARLFNKKYFHFEKKIHEQITPISRNTSLDFKKIAIEVIHDGYIGTPDERRDREMRNITLLLEEYAQNPKDTYTNFQLGQAYFKLAEHEKALFYIEKAMESPLNYRSAAARILICDWINCLNELHRSEEALAILPHYDELKDYADFVLLMGHVYTNLGQYLNAMKEYLSALNCPNCSRDGANTFLPFYHLGNIYYALGDDNMAEMMYKKCGDYTPAQDALKRLIN